METFQAAVSNLKVESAEYVINDFFIKNYATKNCNLNIFKTINNITLELIFLENLNYVNLSPIKIAKIASGNYKGLFYVNKLGNIKTINVEEPVQVNNTIINNYNTNNDLWEEFDS